MMQLYNVRQRCIMLLKLTKWLVTRTRISCSTTLEEASLVVAQIPKLKTDLCLIKPAIQMSIDLKQV